VVRDDVNRRGRAFKVVVPVPECLEDGKEFLVMGVVVQLWSSQSPGVVGNWTNLSVGAGDKQDASDSIVGGISFHDDRGIQNEVGEDGCSSEGKDWMSFTFRGSGQSEMVWILSRDIVKPSGDRRCAPK